jgi:D-alanyl-lipoteichoic acid acyltransferase DltB (MBOAT superfamily)
MLFNSIDFAIFLPISFIVYWLLKDKLKAQNLFILIISYIFYGWWDWRFLSLIIFSSFIDFFIGLKLEDEKKLVNRKLLLALSLTTNLGLLGFFKYYNFFLTNFTEAFSFLGYSFTPERLNIILPVGISFYTFQTLSYTIDIYKRNLNPTRDIISFLGFVSFFPQLVAGPIERASNLLPQFEKKRVFEYSAATDGMRQILWGLFKKIVIADNCAVYVNQIFTNPDDFSGSTLVMGAIFFGFQIYGDFSGYSDIAIGTSKLFGFNLMRNFAFPYFSRDIAEFWRRWHISLSTWFRDYLYVPLGGSKVNTLLKVRNTFIIFVVSGFWHGANWTFIIWGLLNAIYFLPLLLRKKNRSNLEIVAKGKILPTPAEILQIGFTFFLTSIAWVFFRSESINHALHYLDGIFSLSIFSQPEIFPLRLITLLAILTLAEWFQRENQHAMELRQSVTNLPLRWSIYLFVCTLIIAFGNFNKTEFIYFAF